MPTTVPVPAAINRLPQAQQQLLWDLFVTALEGGIGYWSEASSYHIWKRDPHRLDDVDGTDPDLTGFCAAITDIEQGGDFFITASIVLRGLRKFQRGADGLGDRYDRPPQKLDPDAIDDWDFDAETADIVIQLGLFDQVVYG